MKKLIMFGLVVLCLSFAVKVQAQTNPLYNQKAIDYVCEMVGTYASKIQQGRWREATKDEVHGDLKDRAMLQIILSKADDKTRIVSLKILLLSWHKLTNGLYEMDPSAKLTPKDAYRVFHNVCMETQGDGFY